MAPPYNTRNQKKRMMEQQSNDLREKRKTLEHQIQEKLRLYRNLCVDIRLFYPDIILERDEILKLSERSIIQPYIVSQQENEDDFWDTKTLDELNRLLQE